MRKEDIDKRKKKYDMGCHSQDISFKWSEVQDELAEEYPGISDKYDVSELVRYRKGEVRKNLEDFLQIKETDVFNHGEKYEWMKLVKLFIRVDRFWGLDSDGNYRINPEDDLSFFSIWKKKSLENISIMEKTRYGERLAYIKEQLALEMKKEIVKLFDDSVIYIRAKSLAVENYFSGLMAVISEKGGEKELTYSHTYDRLNIKSTERKKLYLTPNMCIRNLNYPVIFIPFEDAPPFMPDYTHFYRCKKDLYIYTYELILVYEIILMQSYWMTAHDECIRILDDAKITVSEERIHKLWSRMNGKYRIDDFDKRRELFKEIEDIQEWLNHKDGRWLKESIDERLQAKLKREHLILAMDYLENIYDLNFITRKPEDQEYLVPLGTTIAAIEVAILLHSNRAYDGKRVYLPRKCLGKSEENRKISGRYVGEGELKWQREEVKVYFAYLIHEYGLQLITTDKHKEIYNNLIKQQRFWWNEALNHASLYGLVCMLKEMHQCERMLKESYFKLLEKEEINRKN